MKKQDLSALKKLPPKKKHSLTFGCLIGAAAIVAATLLVHVMVFGLLKQQISLRQLPPWFLLAAVLCVDACFPLFLVALASLIKHIFRIPARGLERRVFTFSYLCLGVIAAARITMYAHLYVFFAALFALGVLSYLFMATRFLYELFKYHFISCRYY